MVESVFGYLSLESVNGQAEIGTKLDIKLTLFYIFYFGKDFTMVRKSDAQKCDPREVRQIRQTRLANLSLATPILHRTSA